MEIENESTVEDVNNGSETTETVDDMGVADAADTSTDDESSTEGESTDDSETEAEGSEENLEGDDTEGGAESYKPNVKFKAGVYNTETKTFEQKEHDIDPAFHSLMKDAESEKKVRELHEKAYGLDGVKARLIETRGQLQESEKLSAGYKNAIEGARKIYRSAVESGNMLKLDGFFERLKIPKEVVLNYALAHAKLHEMPEAQRTAILATMQAEQRADALEEQNSQFASDAEHSQQQILQTQFDSMMARPEIASLEQAFDAKFGREGLLQDEIIRFGEHAFVKEKKVLGPEQVLKRVLEYYNYQAPTPGQAPTQQSASAAVPPAAPGTKPVVKRTTQTIPNLQGRSTSPVGKKKFTSIDAIKAHRKAEFGI